MSLKEKLKQNYSMFLKKVADDIQRQMPDHEVTSNDCHVFVSHYKDKGMLYLEDLYRIVAIASKKGIVRGSTQIMLWYKSPDEKGISISISLNVVPKD